jgi:hypothetical protein
LFEKLVAAIHLINETDSKVRWNEKINGRQFDVTIRTKSDACDSLTVIECKNSKPVPAKEVDAFVTKSTDINADKAIMVSSSGYQAGAEKVANKHKIELFTLKAVCEIPKGLDASQIVHALNIYDVKLHLPIGKIHIPLPEERNMLPYLIKHTIFKRDKMRAPLGAILESLRKELSTRAHDKAQEYFLPLQRGTKAASPILEKEKTISGLSFKYELVPAQILKGDIAIDPHLVDPVFTKYHYENINTREQFVIPNKDIRIGFDTELEAGKFYEEPRLEALYYCKNINLEVARMFLVESYQHGDLFQMEFTQKLEDAKHYIEIKDKKEIARLMRLYEETVSKNPPDDIENADAASRT